MSGDRVVTALRPWLAQEFKLAGQGVPSTSPATDAWSRPGPKRGPFTVMLTDGRRSRQPGDVAAGSRRVDSQRHFSGRGASVRSVDPIPRRFNLCPQRHGCPFRPEEQKGQPSSRTSLTRPSPRRTKPCESTPARTPTNGTPHWVRWMSWPPARGSGSWRSAPRAWRTFCA